MQVNTCSPFHQEHDIVQNSYTCLTSTGIIIILVLLLRSRPRHKECNIPLTSLPSIQEGKADKSPLISKFIMLPEHEVLQEGGHPPPYIQEHQRDIIPLVCTPSMQEHQRDIIPLVCTPSMQEHQEDFALNSIQESDSEVDYDDDSQFPFAIQESGVHQSGICTPSIPIAVDHECSSSSDIPLQECALPEFTPSIQAFESDESEVHQKLDSAPISTHSTQESKAHEFEEGSYSPPPLTQTYKEGKWSLAGMYNVHEAKIQCV